MFDFNTERNIPTLYSFFALICCAILLSIIAVKNQNKDFGYLYWYGLAIIFLFLSIDEILSIHERLIEPVRQSLKTSGPLLYAWVIPYGVALTVFVVVYLRFLRKLPKRTMILFIVSGVIYVSGAIGFELLGGLQDDIHGAHNITYGVLYTCEEFLEMLGSVVFIYTLVSYMVREFGYLAITVKQEVKRNAF